MKTGFKLAAFEIITHLLQTLKVDAEHMLASKARVTAAGNSLLRIHPDDALLSDRLAKLDADWTAVTSRSLDLFAKLGATREKRLLASDSGLAIDDVTAWLARARQTLGEEEKKKAKGASDVDGMLNAAKVKAVCF